jgi:hypothetical protein
MLSTAKYDQTNGDVRERSQPVPQGAPHADEGWHDADDLQGRARR